jgi:hypothetical protein
VKKVLATMPKTTVTIITKKLFLLVMLDLRIRSVQLAGCLKVKQLVWGLIDLSVPVWETTREFETASVTVKQLLLGLQKKKVPSRLILFSDHYVARQ